MKLLLRIMPSYNYHRRKQPRLYLRQISILPCTTDGEIFDTNDYNVYRCDRNENNSDLGSGGGVLIAVRSNINSERIIVPSTETVEMIIVQLRFVNRRIILCCLYIPSGSSLPVYQDYIDALEKVFDEIGYESNDILCFLGDFNLRHVEWTYQPDYDEIGLPSNFTTGLLPTGAGCSIKAELLNLFLNFGLHQLNSHRNFQGRILDLVFSNEADINISLADPLSRVDVFHDPIEFMIPIESGEIIDDERPIVTSFNFKKANYTELNSYLDSIDWNDKLSSNAGDVDDVIERFYEVLLHGFNLHIPLKRSKMNDHPPWYSKRLTRLKNRMSRVNKNYRNGLTSKLAFCAVRNEFQMLQMLVLQGCVMEDVKTKKKT